MFRKKKPVPPLKTYADKAQPAVDVGSQITQELYRKNVELAHTNRTLSLLRTIDNLVLDSENTVSDLAAGIARSLIDNSAYVFSAIFISAHDGDSTLSLKGISFANDLSLTPAQQESLKSISINAHRDWFEGKDRSEVIDRHQLTPELISEVFYDGTIMADIIIKKSGIQSLAIIKLNARQRLVGILMVGLTEPTVNIKVEELEHLGRIGEASGLAIDNKLLTEENKAVLHKLKLSNQKLKALDEAKDEFISMASHQLRTPLTSVKGYLSMLDEGDAGKLNVTQKQFVNQAFISSQRMVYLIADLLNVSRLKTGKFIIEPTSVYLPDVIESEIAQLGETVKSRGITMKFPKPKAFPMLYLDETKIRQVVMNFADNAIYYTPNGGVVNLALKQTPKSIEFTVTDNGIGVPKAEQHHLFTKFYRAGNARKTRPDGTGLGLFMAKKVVVAQGGAIIFKSQEGKGSTFGFTFAKEKLAVPPKKEA